MSRSMNAAGYGTSKNTRGLKTEQDLDRNQGCSRLADVSSIYKVLREELKNSLADDEGRKQPWPLSTTAFELLISGLVLLNAVQMGLETDYPDATLIWAISEHFFTVAFVLEMLLKLLLLRGTYFQDKGNLLDATLVVLAVTDLWILAPIGANANLQNLSVLRVFRLARMLRLLRIVRHSEKLKIIAFGIIDAFRTTFWIGVLILLCLYAGAIFCTSIIGRAASDLYPGYTTDDSEIDQIEVIAEFNPYVRFGSMRRSMLSLYNIATGAEWGEVVWAVSVKQPLLIVFFICLSFFVTYGIINVIIGVIVDGVMQKTDELERSCEEKATQAKLNQLLRIADLVEKLAFNEDGMVSRVEMARNMKLPDMRDIIHQIKLPSCLSSDEFLALLDNDGDGALIVDDCVRGLYRLIDSNSFQRQCCLQISINTVLQEVRAARADHALVKNMIQNLDASVQELFGEIWACRSHEVVQSPRDPNPDGVKAADQSPWDPNPDGVKAAEALSARLDEQLAHSIGRVRTLDATSAQVTSQLCGSGFRDEVMSYTLKATSDIELLINHIDLRLRQIDRSNLGDCRIDEDGHPERVREERGVASVVPSAKRSCCSEGDANAEVLCHLASTA